MCDFNETTLGNSYQVAHSACSFTLAVIGTVGNLSSILLIRHARLCRNLTMVLLSNLCLAGLMLTAVILPLLGVNGFHTGWLYGDAFCQIFAYVLYVTLSSEYILLMMITVNQYLTVVRNVKHPTLSQFGQKAKVFSLLLLPWLLSAVVYSLPLTKTWGQFGFDPRIHMCTLINFTGVLGMKSAVSLTMLLSTTTIVTYCYTSIFCVHHRSRRRTAPSHKTTSTSTAPSRLPIDTRNAQLIRMISVILINFGITYIPFFIMNATDPCLENTPPSAVVAIVYISFSHSATNPVIYALMNKQILTQWKKVLTQCLDLRKRPSRLGPRERSEIFLLTDREMELKSGMKTKTRAMKEGPHGDS